MGSGGHRRFALKLPANFPVDHERAFASCVLAQIVYSALAEAEPPRVGCSQRKDHSPNRYRVQPVQLGCRFVEVYFSSLAEDVVCEFLRLQPDQRIPTVGSAFVSDRRVEPDSQSINEPLDCFRLESENVVVHSVEITLAKAIALPPSLELTPTEGCPGTIVELVSRGSRIIHFPPEVISSSPDGLFIPVDPQNSPCGVVEEDGDLTMPCFLVISESACSGPYTVTFTLGEQSASASFTVPDTCPGVQSCEAVGGCVQPVNTFALLSPYLAIIAVVGCIGTVILVAKKRHQ